MTTKAGMMFLIFCCGLLAQQTLSTETEVAKAGDFSHYFIYHNTGLSAMVFYHHSATDKSTLVEVAGGPAWKWKNGSLDTYIGGDNNQRLILATVAVVKLPNKLELISISDPKIAVGLSAIPTAWYNRTLIGKGWLFFRTDGFSVRGHGNLSRQLGGEVQIKLKRMEVFSFASGDIITHKPGVTIGIRAKII